jgi:membrane protease YdiL (CAAX protease family)
VLLGGRLMQDIGFVGMAVLFAFLTGGRPWAAQFGLRKTPFWWSVLWILALYFAFITFTAIWQVFVEIDEDTDLLRDLGADRSDLLLVLAAILVTVLAPLIEEFLFRGFIFRALMNSWGPGSARSSPACSSAPSTSARRPSGRSCRSASSGSACASCTGGRGRCTRASRSTRSTTRSPSGP